MTTCGIARIVAMAALCVAGAGCSGKSSGGGADAAPGPDAGGGADTTSTTDGVTPVPDAPVGVETGSEAVGQDAAVAPDLSCVNKPAPTTAKDPLKFIGVAVKYDKTALDGVTVKVLKLDNTQIAATQTAADGKFSFDVPTGGVPVRAYMTLSLSGYATNYFFQADPFSEDGDFPFVLFTPSELGLLYTLSGSGVAYDANKGTIAQGIIDCANMPVENATFSFTPGAASIVYQADPPTYRKTMTYANGFGLGFGLPATAAGQNVEVGGMAGGKSWRSYTARTYPGQLTVTILRP